MSDNLDLDLHQARSSLTALGAREWTIEKITQLTECEKIFGIDMLEDRSLYIYFNPVPSGGRFNSMPIFDNFLVEPSAPSYPLFIEVSGLSQPGQHKNFIKPQPPEAKWKVEELLYYFKNDWILSIEHTRAEFVDIELRGFFQKESTTYPLSLNSDHAKLMLEIAGIKSLGEKVYFPKAQERFDEFLRTGEEPRGKSL